MSKLDFYNYEVVALVLFVNSTFFSHQELFQRIFVLIINTNYVFVIYCYNLNIFI